MLTDSLFVQLNVLKLSDLLKLNLSKSHYEYTNMDFPYDLIKMLSLSSSYSDYNIKQNFLQEQRATHTVSAEHCILNLLFVVMIF